MCNPPSTCTCSSSSGPSNSNTTNSSKSPSPRPSNPTPYHPQNLQETQTICKVLTDAGYVNMQHFMEAHNLRQNENEHILRAWEMIEGMKEDYEVKIAKDGSLRDTKMDGEEAEGEGRKMKEKGKRKEVVSESDVSHTDGDTNFDTDNGEGEEVTGESGLAGVDVDPPKEKKNEIVGNRDVFGANAQANVSINDVEEAITSEMGLLFIGNANSVSEQLHQEIAATTNQRKALVSARGHNYRGTAVGFQNEPREMVYQRPGTGHKDKESCIECNCECLRNPFRNR